MGTIVGQRISTAILLTGILAVTQLFWPSTTKAAAAAYECGGKRATIVGTPERDEIEGTPGDDVIVGRKSRDRIDGRGGDDLICGDRGKDTLIGGDGNDTIYGGHKRDELFGLDGNDTLRGQTWPDKLAGGAGADRLYGGSGGNDLFGCAGEDHLHGGPHDDLLDGGLGSDVIDGGAETSPELGRDGDWLIQTPYMPPNVSMGYYCAPTTDEVPWLHVDLVAGTVKGWPSGTDVIRSIESADGTFGDDVMLGTDGPNHFEGRQGKDTLEGRGGRDFLRSAVPRPEEGHNQYGDEFNLQDQGDVIEGGPGDDIITSAGTLNGGPGDDQLESSYLPSVLDGGTGDDLVRSWVEGAVANVLHGGSGADRLRGFEGRDVLFGDAGDDDLSGGDGEDEVDGGDDRDTCRGEAPSECEVIEEDSDFSQEEGWYGPGAW